MPELPSPLPRADVISRLRAAGCVFAEDEADLLMAEAAAPDALDEMVRRRAGGLPLEHVVGWAEFCGLRIAVDPGVFIPRRRTEFLVRQAAALARETARPGHRVVVVDMCCGSGALGVALVTELGRGAGLSGTTALGGTAGLSGVELHAADADPAAVRCAARNVAAVGGQVYDGDLFGPLPATLRGRVDVLLANVPYVPTAGIALMPPEARLHEARMALDGGADGLAVLRRVAGAAPGWLAPGGHLLMETSERQADQALAAVSHHGLASRVECCPELGATILIATAPWQQRVAKATGE